MIERRVTKGCPKHGEGLLFKDSFSNKIICCGDANCKYSVDSPRRKEDKHLPILQSARQSWQ